MVLYIKFVVASQLVYISYDLAPQFCQQICTIHFLCGKATVSYIFPPNDTNSCLLPETLIEYVTWSINMISLIYMQMRLGLDDSAMALCCSLTVGWFVM